MKDQTEKEKRKLDRQSNNERTDNERKQKETEKINEFKIRKDMKKIRKKETQVNIWSNKQKNERD